MSEVCPNLNSVEFRTLSQVDNSFPYTIWTRYNNSFPSLPVCEALANNELRKKISTFQVDLGNDQKITLGPAEMQQILATVNRAVVDKLLEIPAETLSPTVISQLYTELQTAFRNGDYGTWMTVLARDVNYPNLVNISKKALSRFNLVIKEDEDLVEEDRAKDTIDQRPMVYYSTRSGAAPEIRMIIATTGASTEITKDNNILLKSVSSGTEGRIWNKLLTLLANHSSPAAMLSTIQKEIQKGTSDAGWLKDLYLRLTNISDPHRRVDLQTKFWQSFNNYVYGVEKASYDSQNNEVSVYNENKRSRGLPAKDEVRGNIANALLGMNAGTAFNNATTVVPANIRTAFNKLKDTQAYQDAKLRFDKAKQILKFLGVVLPEQVYNVNEQDTIDAAGLLDSLGSLQTPVADPFSLTGRQATTQYKIAIRALNNLVTTYSNLFPDSSELSLVNSEGSTIHPVNRRNELTRLTQRIEELGYEGNLKTAWGDFKLLQIIKNGTTVSFLDGLNEFGSNKSGVLTADSTIKDYIAILINGMFNHADSGRAVITLAPTGDKSLEYGLSADKSDLYELPETIQVINGRYNPSTAVISGVIELLNYELERIYDAKAGAFSGLQYWEKQAKDFQIFSFLSPETQTALLKQAELSAPFRKKGPELWKMISVDVVNFFTTEINKLYKLAEDEMGISEIGEIQGISSALIQPIKTKRPGETASKSIIAAFAVNNILFSAEQSVILFGDISAYKNTVADYFKRTQAIVGTGKSFRTDPEMNAYIANNILGGSRLPTDGTFKVSVADDVIVRTATAAAFNEPAYKNVDEADAQGWINFESYIDAMVRAGEFSWPVIRDVIYKIRTNQELTEEDLKTVKYFPPLKLQYSGYKPAIEGKGAIAPEIKQKYGIKEYLKFSVLPLIPTSTQKYQINGIRQAMEEQGISMLVVPSASKVGSEGIKPLYNEGLLDTNFNFTYLNYDDLIIQVDNKPKGSKRILFGTQIRKLIFSNLLGPYAEKLIGKEKAKKVTELFKEYNDILSELVDREYDKLINELGADKQEDNIILTPEAYSNLLRLVQDEMIDRELPENMVGAADFMIINRDKYNVVFDAFPDKNKVENILCALVTNRIVKQEMPGQQLVQAAATGWQPLGEGDNKYRRFNKKIDNAWVADGEGELGFIKDENGKITAVDVLLPSSFKYAGSIDQTVKTLIGYRIPTEGYNSIIKINVRGYLPPEQGGAIIVPSDITTQAGSDFDIDKLYVFMPNTYTSGNKVKAVKYFKTADEAYEQRYGRKQKLLQEMERIINEERENILDAENNVEGRLLLSIWDKYGVTDFSEDEVNDIIQEYFGVNAPKYKDLKTLVESFPSKEEFEASFSPITGNSKAALENRVIEIMAEILSEKYVAEQAVSPLSADVVKKYKTDTIDRILGKGSAAKSSSQIISPSYQIQTRKTFLAAKKGVGGAAMHNAHHPLTQAADVSYYLSPEGIDFLFRRTGMKVNTNTYGVSLAGVHDQKGRFINKILSALLNSFVDAAKDPYIEELNFNYSTSNAAYFLIRAGADIENVLALINQPVIKDFVRMSKNNQAITNSMFSGPAEQELISKYLKALRLTDISQFKRLDYNEEILKANLNNPANAALQLTVLLDFLQYNDMGKALNQLVAASSYDRTQPKTIAESMLMLDLEKSVKTQNLFHNFSKLENVGFLKTFKEKGASTNVKLFSQAFISQYPIVQNLMNYVISHSYKNKEDMVNKFTNFLLTYLTQNYLREKSDLVNFSDIDQVRTLFSENLDAVSVGNLLYYLKNDKAYAGLELTKSFLNPNPPTTKAPFSTIRYYNKKLDKLSSDNLTTEFRKIYDANKTTGQALHLITIFQNGIGEGFDSYLKLVPYEQHIPVFAEAISDQLKKLDAETVLDSFYLNNTHTDGLVPFFRQKDVVEYTSDGIVMAVGDGKKFITAPRILKSIKHGVMTVLKLTAVDKGLDLAYYTRTQERGIMSSGKKIIEANSAPYITKEGVKTWTIHPTRAKSTIEFTVDEPVNPTPTLPAKEEAKPVTNSSSTQSFGLSQTIKSGVPELFESNPELANAVYEALGYISNLNKLKVQDIKTKVSDKFNNLKNTRIELKEEVINDEALSELEKTLLVKAIDGIFDIPGSNPFIIDDIPGYASYNVKKFEEYIKYEFPDLSRKEITNILSQHIEHIGVQHKAALLSEKEGESGLPSNLAELELAKLTLEQKQQAQQLYSQYLDTIFPNSKVKDIVYHYNSSEKKFDKFDKSYIGTQSLGSQDGKQGFSFVDNKLVARAYGSFNTEIYSLPKEVWSTLDENTYKKYDKNIISVLINPQKGDWKSQQDGWSEIMIKNVDNIHILGSKQDIEGFKEFVKEAPTSNSVFTQPKLESTVPASPEAKISEVYNSLTTEQKQKIKSLDQLIAEYNQIPFEYDVEDFIQQSIKCEL